MKKGTEVWSDYDQTGRWCLKMKKRRGKFTLDEITELAMQHEYDYYGLVIKAIGEDGVQYFDDYDTGDCVTLYRITDLLTDREN